MPVLVLRYRPCDEKIVLQSLGREGCSSSVREQSPLDQSGTPYRCWKPVYSHMSGILRCWEFPGAVKDLGSQFGVDSVC